MHPFENISDQSIVFTDPIYLPVLADETITLFLILSAHYLGLPADWLKHAKQVNKSSNKTTRSSHD